MNETESSCWTNSLVWARNACNNRESDKHLLTEFKVRVRSSKCVQCSNGGHDRHVMPNQPLLIIMFWVRMQLTCPGGKSLVQSPCQWSKNHRNLKCKYMYMTVLCHSSPLPLHLRVVVVDQVEVDPVFTHHDKRVPKPKLVQAPTHTGQHQRPGADRLQVTTRHLGGGWSL